LSHFTASQNSDPIAVGSTIIPGVGSYDAGSYALSQLIFFFPFFVGGAVSNNRSHEELLRCLVIAGIIYFSLGSGRSAMSPSFLTGYTVTLRRHLRWRGATAVFASRFHDQWPGRCVLFHDNGARLDGAFACWL